MVNIVVISLLMLSVLSCSILDGHNVDTGKVHLTSLSITSNGVYSGLISSDETIGHCQKFTVNKTDVMHFYENATIVTTNDYAQTLIASNCYASGRFVDSNNQEGNWRIDQARRGMLYYSDDKATHYYYCGECNNPMFYEPCGEDCNGIGM